jgi:hypothetical protein
MSEENKEAAEGPGSAVEKVPSFLSHGEEFRADHNEIFGDRMTLDEIDRLFQAAEHISGWSFWKIT